MKCRGDRNIHLFEVRANHGLALNSRNGGTDRIRDESNPKTRSLQNDYSVGLDAVNSEQHGLPTG
jgi:hypothetical protein